MRYDEKIWLKHYDQGVPATVKYPKVPLFTFLEEMCIPAMILPHGANTIVLLVACAKDMALHGAQLYGIQPMIPPHRRICNSSCR